MIRLATRVRHYHARITPATRPRTFRSGSIHANLVRDVRSDRNVGIFAVYNRDRVNVIADQILGGLRFAGQNDDRVCASLTGLAFDGRQDIVFARVDATGALDDTYLT